MTAKLTLVEAALDEIPHKPEQERALRDVLNRFGPSIAKKARQQEREALFATAGAKTIEDLSILARTVAELNTARDREEAKHVRGAKREGMVIGMAMGAALTVAVGSTLLLAGSRATVEGVGVGMMVRGQDENDARLRAYERSEPYQPQPNAP